MTGGATTEWIAASDGLPIFCRSWEAAPNPRAEVLYVHGLASHSGWIAALASRLAAAGISVHALDLRGHGCTGPEPGRLPGPQRLLRDLETVHEVWAARRSSVPWFAMGTSLGGCLVTSFARRVPHAQRGLILISPAFDPIYLSTRESMRIAADLMGGGHMPVPTPRARGLRICGSQEVRDSLAADPFSLSTLSARAHFSALRIVTRAKRDLAGVSIPVLCLQGERDPVVSATKNRDRFADRPDTTYRSISDGFHDLGLEPDVGAIDRTVATWIGEHADSKA
ncbi:MAG: alpha/beta fold hydrolase [Candidatus Eisenbacteria bacterium]|uniref:Alpha/beta fold hydrolase n=1 Tax=Eiseniibacteriota bacterium TaxID=2212470 RepID=A0A956LWE1_UNCEI|nr:alpha/beta fold hydrolase [Candidatus Eisenbacteria bacterium]